MIRKIISFDGLLQAKKAVAAVEFALVLPVLTVIFLYGAELVNLAYAHLRIGEMATLAADDASRVRTAITEDNINELFTGAKLIGSPLGFAQNGRIILSSVQSIPDTASVPQVQEYKIRWQRCIGANAANSSYGLQDAVVPLPGIGPADRKAGPSLNSEMIFAEVVYRYQPLISEAFTGPQTLRATAAAIVRERTSNTILSGSSAAKTCDLAHSA